ncbi:hypothetical protein BEI60_03405 [Eisenbergiella tayi]|nr:hypothetical protein BEI60_03405 [Eisenbergiella tayi]
MIKVDSRKTVAEVAAITYRAKRKRNFIAITAIVLTTLLTAVILALGISYWNTVTLRSVRMNGMDYDMELTEPREDQVAAIRAMEGVKAAGISIKCAILESYGDWELDKTQLYWVDRTCWEQQCIPALELFQGDYPEKEEELMLSVTALAAMGIEDPVIGMELPVEYSVLGLDSMEERQKKTFLLSGYYKDYTGRQKGYVSECFLEETGVKQTDLTRGTLKISLRNPLFTEKDIMRIQSALGLDRQIIRADSDTIVNFCKTAAALAGLLLMILAAGYLFIYNTLYISISKDIRYYGQLKTIGMTSVQLKGLIYRQALWNAAVGIPVGLAAGMILADGVIPGILHIVNPILEREEIIAQQPWIYGLAGMFALLTNLTASMKPAKIAGECSPVEAIRYIGGGGGKKKFRQESSLIFSMVWRNLFRDKKQAAVIFLSFVIAGINFLTVNVVIRQNDARSVLNASWGYDIRFKNETTLKEKLPLITEEIIEQVRGIPGVKEIRTVSSAEIIVPLQEQVFGSYYRVLYQSRYSPGSYDKDMAIYREQPDYYLFRARLIGIDRAGFTRLNAALENVLEKDAFEAGEIAVAIPILGEPDSGQKESIRGKTVVFSVADAGTNGEHEICIAEVGAVTDNPAFFGSGYTPDLIVSQNYAQKLLGNTFTELVEVDYESPFSTDTERKIKEIFAGLPQVSCESKMDRYHEMEITETRIKVLGNCIGILMVFLAMMNYTNMMIAGVQNRAREFAALESVGMTAKQIRKVLMLEGCSYAILSAAASCLAGIPISLAVFRNLNRYGVPYSFPWLSNLMVFGGILILCAVAPVIIFGKTQKGSIIERLRENE